MNILFFVFIGFVVVVVVSGVDLKSRMIMMMLPLIINHQEDSTFETMEHFFFDENEISEYLKTQFIFAINSSTLIKNTTNCICNQHQQQQQQQQQQQKQPRKKPKSIKEMIQNPPGDGFAYGFG